jgi:putative N6-adenine-specific DNA methylase
VGNDAWIISHHEELFDKIGFRPSTKYALFNGLLECEFRKYQIFDGKLKERREEGLDIKTDEDRRHNLKFKPHKKNEDGEWTSSRSGRKVPTDDEEHYFKSKPFKERPSKDIPYEEEKDRKWGKDSRWKMFEAEDEEEAEIINRHIGKWGDRVARPSRGEKKPERRDSRDERERFTDRESRQEARKSFFAGKSPKEFGERKASFEGRRGERDERRPRRDGERPARKFDGQKGEGRPFRDRKDGKK